MKRLMLALILCLSPLQTSFAVVSSYCEHEPATTDSTHLGHHEHQHEHQDSKDNPSDAFPQTDLDCAHHSLPVLTPCYGIAGITNLPRSYHPDHPAEFRSAVLDPTERPPLPSRA